ncbi:TPA: ABC transporter permease [Candidatus Bathyarchaeota archaeon]|nr:ABC transporter permease [Candidatus Bathyarchaeota archaeon]
MRTEFLTIFWRDMLKFFRIRSMLFTSLVQPAIWLALYGLSMSSNFALLMPGDPAPPGVVSVDYLTFMAAGVVSLTILFTCLYSGITLQFDKEFGLMKEMVASPLPRSHIIWGLSLSGVAKSLIQATVIFTFGYILGVRFFPGFAFGNILLSISGILLFVVLLALGLLFLSSMIALRLESHEGLQGVITLLSLPLFFASNALYPINALPTVIRMASYVNPLSHFINGFRYFSLGSNFYAFGVHYTYSGYEVLISLAFLVGFDVVTYLLALRTIKKAKIV